MVHWRKPFVHISEKDRGEAKYALVYFDRHSSLYETRTLIDDPQHPDVYRTVVSVVRYRYYLYIDLWLCVLEFNWEGR